MFETVSGRFFNYQLFAPWKAAALVHGFAGKDIRSGQVSLEHLKLELGVSEIWELQQVHGSNCLDLRDPVRLQDYRRALEAGFPHPEALRADAVIAPRGNIAEKKLALLIRTADCLPLILRSNLDVALIHCGWRGLANGILMEVVRKFDSVSEVEVVMGPCAGPDNYEVGPEVLEQIGPAAIFKPGNADRSMLDIPATAALLMREAGVESTNIWTSPTCTIADSGYNSYRISGSGAGRNYTFVVIAAPSSEGS